jgi:hydroxyethylthiazole kinase-like uncharacterized protein yjeF
MMEHAAMSLAQTIRTRFPAEQSVLIVCGGGNNGADGLALARLLEGSYDVSVYLAHEPTSTLALLQLKRLETLGLKPVRVLKNSSVIVDALYGSGLNRPLDPKTSTLIETLNSMSGTKIACDLPSGLHGDGTCDDSVFKADITITMGALKRGMFSDSAKEFVGEIIVADLGVHHDHYETPSSWHLLEESDIRLPHRTKVSGHKGTYGHLAVVCGEHTGAAILCASAALRFGTGLVSLVSNENISIPHELMQSHNLPSTTSAVAIGMGLGAEFDDDELSRLYNNNHPLILDADIFAHPLFLNLLERPNIILTPHPKEFTTILISTKLADIETCELQNNRFKYVELFCTRYPNVTLLLKGANVIIGRNGEFFINPHGSVILAKGGSGDVLCGLIGALLAQGYDPLKSAIQGSLAHTLAGSKVSKNNYALTPLDLIESVTTL